MVNAAFGAVIVTPWTVRGLPEEDLEEILYMADLGGQLREVESKE